MTVLVFFLLPFKGTHAYYLFSDYSFFSSGHLLVVLEIAENGSLLEFLKKSRGTNQNYENINSGGLTEEMKLRIDTDVAKGMSHLANCRVNVRDRLFFTREGGEGWWDSGSTI